MAAELDQLRTEHRNIARLLEALEHQIEVFARGGSADYDIIRGIADYFLDYPDACHHPKEDVVFARLRERCPEVADPIDEISSEHRQMHDRARWFRDTVHLLLGGSDIARDAVVAAARVFIEAERQHMEKEENGLFALCESRLTEEDWKEIRADLACGPDPLFTDRVEEEFAALRERLLAWESEHRDG